MAETDHNQTETAFDPEEYLTWEELAHDLHEKGGVPKRRSEVVALIALGHTYGEVKEILELSSRGQASNHAHKYHYESVPEAEWLAENGPKDLIQPQNDG